MVFAVSSAEEASSSSWQQHIVGMSSEDAEVAALDRVLTRTVLTKDEDLQQVGMLIHIMQHHAQRMDGAAPVVGEVWALQRGEQYASGAVLG